MPDACLQLHKGHPCWNNWKWQVANRFKTLEQLAAILSIKKNSQLAQYRNVLERYPWSITPYYLSLINQHDPLDPIRLQSIPSPKEIDFSLPGSDEDPLAERRHMPCRGLVHRYRDRVLVISTGLCFSYCRHCNRKRNWKKGVSSPSASNLAQMTGYISSHPEIREVIISGGDPLTLPVEKLDRLLHAFKKLENIEVLRLGTRAPVVLPMRITNDIADMLAAHRPLWINTHFNHPAEVTPEAAAACDRLLSRGIPVSNHTVLLHGINDKFETLQNLFTMLNTIMVRPYYLFHCDAVKGTDHFRTDLETGMKIMQKLWGDTGGLCLPNYVVDLPEGGGKAPVMRSFLLEAHGDTAFFKTFDGKIIRYSGATGAAGHNYIFK